MTYDIKDQQIKALKLIIAGMVQGCKAAIRKGEEIVRQEL